MSDSFDFDSLFTPLPEPTKEELDAIKAQIDAEKKALTEQNTASPEKKNLNIGLPECAFFPKTINIPYPNVVKSVAKTFKTTLPYENGLPVPDALTTARPNLLTIPYNDQICEIFLNFGLTDDKIKTSIGQCKALIQNTLKKNQTTVDTVKTGLTTANELVTTTIQPILNTLSPYVDTSSVQNYVNNFNTNLKVKINILESSIAQNVCNKLASKIQNLPREQKTCANVRNLLEGNISFC